MQNPVFIQNRIMAGLVIVLLGMSAINKLLDWMIKRNDRIHKNKMRKLEEELSSIENLGK
jgi:hypothetical protein